MGWCITPIITSGWSGPRGVVQSPRFNYRDMEREDGIFMAVAESACRYRAPAHFDDEIVVKT